MRETSIISYKELFNEGKIGKRQFQVIKAIERLKYATDNEISEFLNYEDPNYIRPRRKELYDLGIVIEHDKSVCKVSGKTAIRWKLNNGEHKIRVKNCLSEVQFKRLMDLLRKANEFQKSKIMEWLKSEKENS